MTDAQIRGMLAEFRERYKKGERPTTCWSRRSPSPARRWTGPSASATSSTPSTSSTLDLPPNVEEMYKQLKVQMDATPPAPPDGEFIGATGPVPGWMQLDIPVEIYEAVRTLYPESRPPFRARPFDVQLIGGMVLYQARSRK
jgi:hypothetical protein